MTNPSLAGKKKIPECECRGHREPILTNDCICSPDNAEDLRTCKRMEEMNLSKYKKEFEANMLDGDKLEDCGGTMLSAESVFEYLTHTLESERKEWIKQSDAQQNGLILVKNLEKKEALETQRKEIKEKIKGCKYIGFTVNGQCGQMEKEIMYQINKTIDDILKLL